jgi:hypothetical protein
LNASRMHAFRYLVTLATVRLADGRVWSVEPKERLKQDERFSRRD